MIITYNERQVPYVWYYIVPFIQRALDRGCRYSLEDIYDGLRKQNLQLWTWQPKEIEAVMITAMSGDECYIATMSGENMKDWLPHIKDVEEWAKSNGCKKIIIQGRKGWSRLLGYKITGRDDLNLHIMSKNLCQM